MIIETKDERVKELLDIADILKLTQITVKSHTMGDIEYNLSADDKDYVTFHKGIGSPNICDKLQVCHYNTTNEPVYKDWYMSINYHS